MPPPSPDAVEKARLRYSERTEGSQPPERSSSYATAFFWLRVGASSGSSLRRWEGGAIGPVYLKDEQQRRLIESALVSGAESGEGKEDLMEEEGRERGARTGRS